MRVPAANKIQPALQRGRFYSHLTRSGNSTALMSEIRTTTENDQPLNEAKTNIYWGNRISMDRAGDIRHHYLRTASRSSTTLLFAAVNLTSKFLFLVRFIPKAFLTLLRVA